MSLKTPLLIAAVATAAMTFNASAHEKPKMQGMKGDSAASMELHRIMTSGMKMPMKMSGDVDKDFAAMMIMHHQMAVKMADVEIKKGKSAALKAMARKMKAAQQAEIEQLAPFAK